MGKRLYVGNLSYTTTEAELKNVFADYGTLLSVRVVTDRDSGQSKGFGFVEFALNSDADTAIEELNGFDLGGRFLRVSVAEAKPTRPVGSTDRQERPNAGFKQSYVGSSQFQGHYQPAPSNFPEEFLPKRFRGPKRPKRRREQEESGWDD